MCHPRYTTRMLCEDCNIDNVYWLPRSLKKTHKHYCLILKYIVRVAYCGCDQKMYLFIKNIFIIDKCVIYVFYKNIENHWSKSFFSLELFLILISFVKNLYSEKAWIKSCKFFTLFFFIYLILFIVILFHSAISFAHKKNY